MYCEWKPHYVQITGLVGGEEGNIKRMTDQRILNNVKIKNRENKQETRALLMYKKIITFLHVSDG